MSALFICVHNNETCNTTTALNTEETHLMHCLIG